VQEPVAAGLEAVRERVLAEAPGQQLRALRDALLPIEDEFDVTLTAHMAVNVTRNLLRIYARV
jgi:hypothetical protein